MNHKELIESLKKIAEGEVVDFTKFKRKKQSDEFVQNMDSEINDLVNKFNKGRMIVEIMDVTVTFSTVNGFVEGNKLTYGEFQRKLYELDKQQTNNSNTNYNLHTDALVKITANNEVNMEKLTCYFNVGSGNVNLEQNIRQQLKEFAASQNPPLEIMFDNDPIEEPKDTNSIVEVGDILYTSWGYSMTLVDFYKVIAKTNSSIRVARLEQKYKPVDKDLHSGEGTTTPIVDEIKEDNRVDGKTFRISKSGMFICKIQGQSAYKWDGKPKHYNTYD